MLNPHEKQPENNDMREMAALLPRNYYEFQQQEKKSSQAPNRISHGHLPLYAAKLQIVTLANQTSSYMYFYFR